jgi:hypothetical protein
MDKLPDEIKDRLDEFYHDTIMPLLSEEGTRWNVVNALTKLKKNKSIVRHQRVYFV